ncbi:MAG: hypothetical protein Q8O67_25780 [Deltaproteobacteria bacterium]|nr:hypothetical protein [Deltaproteobacteria bacterium]
MKCRRCNSEKVVPGARVLTSASLFKTDDLRVHVKLNALEPLFAKLSADVCGDCGAVDLVCAEAQEFYSAWAAAKSG